MYFLKLTTIFLVLILVLCSCKNTDTVSDASSQLQYSSEIQSVDIPQNDISSEESKEQNISSQTVSSSENNSSEAETSKDTQINSDKSENSSEEKDSSKTDISKPVNSQNQSQIAANSSETSSKPQKKTVKAEGIDVSKWQGKIDWKKVKASGIDFAIIRIGQRGENGKIVKDECADYNIQQANENGILIGVYYFSAANSVSEAVEDAKWVADSIKYYPVSYPVVWDCEGFSDNNSRMNSLSIEERTDIATCFLDKIESLGYDSMFYGAENELSDSLMWDTKTIEKNCKIWIASYPDITYPKITSPDYQGKFDMWQYTDKGSVSGINGDVDLVVSYFSAKKSSPKSNSKPPVATEPLEEGYTSVNIKVTAKDTVNLRDSASTKGKIVGTLKNGEVLTKTADGINGWSKLSFNGKTVYAISSYLTDDLTYKTPEENSDGFKKTNETVTAKDKTNLRSVPSSADDSTIVYTLKNGETAKRIGISQNGWSKLEYKGKTLYAVSSYLTTDLNFNSPTDVKDNNSPDLKTVFTDVSEKVTAKSETNLRSLPSVTDSEIIHTLKNGEYITRTGVSDNGWSRLEYSGKTVYAVSSYLTK